MTPLINVPSATGTIAALGVWSSPWFDSLFPLAIVVAGLTIGALIIVFILDGIIGAFREFRWRRGIEKDEYEGK